MNAPTSRRDFLKAGAGLALAFYLPGSNAADALTAGTGHSLSPQAPQFSPNAWLTITPDNRVIFVLDRVEMGQGTMTSHATLLGEELEVDPQRIEVHFAGAEKREYRNSAFGIQLTGGSTSVATSWQPLREAGATAREMLKEAAARRLKVDRNSIRAENGVLYHDASRSQLTYGEVCLDAARVRQPSITLKSPADYRYIGKAQKRVDLIKKITGTAEFGIDVQVPGMVNAYILRSPVRFGRPQTIHSAAALKADGVENVVALDHGVAVVARHWYQAKKAAQLLQVSWEDGELAKVSSEQILADYRKAVQESGNAARKEGNLDDGFEAASRTIEAIYEAPYLAHATMEPQNCVALVQKDRCDIWAPTQWPQLAQEVAARITGLAHDDITVHQTFIGGGFGRRIVQDYVEETVQLAMAIKKPVKVIWSREDDMKNDFYRPCAVNYYKGGVNAQGDITALLARVATQSIVAYSARDFVSTMAPTWVPHGLKRMTAGMAGAAYKKTTLDTTTVEGTATFPYAIANNRVDFVNRDPGVPVGFWRSVGHSFNTFMTESFIDELAHAAGKDSYQFRRRLLKEAPRHLAVLDLAAEKAGWGKPLPAGVFRGIAVAESFASYVAQVVEVRIENGEVRVLRVVNAVDCGTVVNPDIVRAQVESAVIFALSAALKGEITLQGGQVQQSNFHDYPVLRLNECPQIDIHIVASSANPTGIGEPGVPPLAPALGNAIFAATGQRLRKLPLRLS